jgi:hypothetical protein
MILSCATKVLNDTMGENGLVPTLLVFGIIPRFPILSTDLPEQKERMRVITAAQAEYNTIVAERRLLSALQSRVPAAADRIYQVGEEVLVWRERPNSWTGPLIIRNMEEKIVTVYDPATQYSCRFNTAQVKPYVRDLPATDADEDWCEIMHETFSNFITGA